MKKIVGGKKYDTDTADLLGTHTSPLGSEERTLYRKKNGEFFFYANSAPHIRPTTLELARSWVETYLSVDEFEKIFGEVSE